MIINKISIKYFYNTIIIINLDGNAPPLSLLFINKISHKRNDLASILFEYFGSEINLARIKNFGLFFTAFCKVQAVCFEKLSCAFDSSQG